MLLLDKPSVNTIRQFINEQQSHSVSYKEIGSTKNGVCPPGYGTDRVRIELGSGENIFATALAAFKNWEEFEVGWARAFPADTHLVPNSVVSILAWHGFFWSLNACRIVYVINEEGPITKFGFGYGTLPEHAEIGEERFLLEWDKSTDIVSYDILAFSNPSRLIGWLAYPLVRFIQNRFRRDSAYILKEKILLAVQSKKGD